MRVELDGESLELTDGGIYDNLGLEPLWRDHAVVLVSDAAPSFTPHPEIAASVWSNLRYVVTLLEQATDVRKRWLIANFIARRAPGRVLGDRELPVELRLRCGVPGRPDRRA